MARPLTEDDIHWIADHVINRIGQRDIGAKAIGIGDPEKSGAAGNLKAENQQVDLTGLDLTNVDVPHTLGVVPTACTLIESENASTPATHLSAIPVSKDKWTTSNCRVAVHVITGVQAGTVARFRVEGA